MLEVAIAMNESSGTLRDVAHREGGVESGSWAASLNNRFIAMVSSRRRFGPDVRLNAAATDGLNESNAARYQLQSLWCFRHGEALFEPLSLAHGNIIHRMMNNQEAQSDQGAERGGTSFI